MAPRKSKAKAAETGPKPYPTTLVLNESELLEARSVMELMMGHLSASIRRKSEWWIKRKDPAILAKWKEEALAATMVWNKRTNSLEPLAVVEGRGAVDADSVVKLNEKQVDYVLQELEGYEKLREEKTGIEVGCFDGIWHSDRLISPQTRADLISGVSVLENVPDGQKDWHPGSDDLVLDLVHPSLYCLVYGKTLRYETRPRDNSDKPELVPVRAPPTKRYDPLVESKRFAWIPTDFKVDADGNVTTLGYINNLFPGHTRLYKSIEECITAFIPMWDRVLSDVLDPLPLRIDGEYLDITETDPRYPKEEDEPSEKNVKPDDIEKDDGNEEWESEEDYYDKVDKFWQEWEESKYVMLPDVPDEGYTGMLEKRSVTISLKERELQVIVKLANIHLTPNKPEYGGGSWHVEGMLNERIVASGIYYYEQENITSSELAFRIAIRTPQRAEQIQAETYDYYAFYRMWGLEMDYDEPSKLNQCVGSVETTNNLCLAFPNIYQHRVSPFKLADPTKPGHRKILALFLVDPNIEPIPSTTVIPPQQREWAFDALRRADEESLVNKLPVELVNMIEKHSPMMDLEQAKAVRLELMKERTRYVNMDGVDDEDHPFERGFNLCEH